MPHSSLWKFYRCNIQGQPGFLFVHGDGWQSGYGTLSEDEHSRYSVKPAFIRLQQPMPELQAGSVMAGFSIGEPPSHDVIWH